MFNLTKSLLPNLLKVSTTSTKRFIQSNAVVNEQSLKEAIKKQPRGRSKVKANENLDAAQAFVSQPIQLHTHVLNIHSTLNNTILTLCTNDNKVLFTCSSGTAGFKKARRSGFEAAYQAATQLVEKSIERKLNVTDVLVKFKGFGPGREAVFRALLSNTNWHFNRLVDCTPLPHGGCRPPKPRRL